MTKIIFITGGHYTPARAVIDEISKLREWEIFYLGRKFAQERDKALSYEYLDMSLDTRVHFLELTTGRLQAKFFVKPWQSIFSLLKVFVGLGQSLFWLAKFHPNIILSFGGYMAFPVVLTGWILDIPIITHEQTKIPGLTNRIIEPLASKICVSFPSMVKSSKYIFTGNPIRTQTFNSNPSREIQELHKIKTKDKFPVLYLTGGKQGSHALNSWALANLGSLAEKAITIIQCGDNLEFNDYLTLINQASNLPQNLGDRILIKKFFGTDEIGSVFSLSDLVIGRSGANLVFDLAALGKPAILVPLPDSRGGEQLENARELEARGLAHIVDQKDINDKLMITLDDMLANLGKYQKNPRKTSDLYIPDSAQRILKIVLEITK